MHGKLKLNKRNARVVVKVKQVEQRRKQLFAQLRGLLLLKMGDLVRYDCVFG